MSMLMGMAAATMALVRRPRNSMSTSSTSRSPEKMLFSRSATIRRMSCDWSRTRSNLTPAGARVRATSRIFSTRSAMGMMSAPMRFLTATVMLGTPSRRAWLVRSLNV